VIRVAQATFALVLVLAGPDRISTIEGVYKTNVPSAGEDVIEIARYDASHIYVRADLHFAPSGHVCWFYGIAGLENDKFVYRAPGPQTTRGSSCVLTVSTTATELVLTDVPAPGGDQTCKDYCGLNGSLTDYRLKLSARRPIRYMARLKASREYAAAVQEFTRSK
jgi:hypothetical protein